MSLFQKVHIEVVLEIFHSYFTYLEKLFRKLDPIIIKTPSNELLLQWRPEIDDVLLNNTSCVIMIGSNDAANNLLNCILILTNAEKLQITMHTIRYFYELQ
jgi:hypothetical protein